MTKKKDLNVGLVGYGFMGRTHSNAFLQAPRFFDVPFRPVLKAVCARNSERAKGFAENWGYESIETDWRVLVQRKDIDLIDIASPNDTHAEIAILPLPIDLSATVSMAWHRRTTSEPAQAWFRKLLVAAAGSQVDARSS